MSRVLAVFIYVCSGMLAALSQLLLKAAADKSGQVKGLKKYLNLRVVFAYFILFMTIFMNMAAMRYMPYKFTPILAAVSYVFVLVLSRIFLKEKIRKKQAVGAFFIFAGIVIFNVG